MEAKELSNYRVDADGRVFSYLSNRYIKQDLSRLYPTVVLCDHGVHKKWAVHRLVASLFIPNPENKPCVNHINGNKTDNRVENLEWCTYSENEIHSRYVLSKKISHSIITRAKMSCKAKGRNMDIAVNASALKRRGKPANNRTPVILNGEFIYGSITEGSIMTGVSISSISNNLIGKSKTTKKGKWEYVVKN